MKQLFTIFTLIFVTSTYCVASTNVEEVTYDQLVNELKTKKSQPARQSHFSGPQHFGLDASIIESMSNYSMGGQSGHPLLTGIGISGNTNIFENWKAEGGLKLFSPSEDHGLKASAEEIDAKVMYSAGLSGNWSYFVGPGFGVRFSEVSSNSLKNGGSSSPLGMGIMLGGGFNYKFNQTISANIGADMRAPFGGASEDKGSFDLAVGLATQL